MTDYEEKFLKLQKYCKPLLEQVQTLQDENAQLKISQSQELELQRSVLESAQETFEQEKREMKNEKEEMKKEKEELKKMKEKFQSVRQELEKIQTRNEEDKMKDKREKESLLEKRTRLIEDRKSLEGEKTKLKKIILWIEKEKKSLQEERTKLNEEKDKMSKDRSLLDEDRNIVMVKLRSLEDEKVKVLEQNKSFVAIQKKITRDLENLSAEKLKIKERENFAQKMEEKITEERESFMEEMDQTRQLYEEKNGQLEEERIDVLKQKEELEKDRIYLDEDWCEIWKCRESSRVISHSEPETIVTTSEIKLVSKDFKTPDFIEGKIPSSVEENYRITNTGSEATKRKRGRSRKCDVTRKNMNKTKLENVSVMPLDLKEEPSSLEQSYQELLLTIEEEPPELSYSQLSAKQLIEEVSLLL